MPNAFTSSNAPMAISAATVVGVLLVGVVLVVLVMMWWPRTPSCPSVLVRETDGSLVLRGAPTAPRFATMNDFQQWWHSSGKAAECPIPLLEGGRSADSWPKEETYAKTPINKVDDYEFSRIVGYERGGHLIVPKQDFNTILENRQFDWADMPVTAEARRASYAGLREGFTASGHLGSVAQEAAARYGERRAHTRKDDMDVECRLSREASEVAEMVERAYSDDPDYEPVITRVGPHHWEVNELKPRRRVVDYAEPQEDRVVNTDDTRVRQEIVYETDRVNRGAIDPFFPPEDGQLPWQSERYTHMPRSEMRMERMMGPTLDRADWTVPAPLLGGQS